MYTIKEVDMQKYLGSMTYYTAEFLMYYYGFLLIAIIAIIILICYWRNGK